MENKQEKVTIKDMIIAMGGLVCALGSSVALVFVCDLILHFRG